MTTGCPGIPAVVLWLAVLGACCVLLLAMVAYCWVGEMIQDRLRSQR